MTTQHTPEPWEYRFAYNTDADHKRVIACVNGCKGIVDPETAIPELLADLQGLIHSVEHEINPHGRIVQGIKNARAAIAKATQQP